MKQNSQTAAAHATTFEPPPPLDLSPMRSEETDGKRPSSNWSRCSRVGAAAKRDGHLVTATVVANSAANSAASEGTGILTCSAYRYRERPVPYRGLSRREQMSHARI